jgi:hypothetical protein
MASEKVAFYSDIWTGYRPYFVTLSINSLVAITIYLWLYVFDRIQGYFPIPGWGARFVDALHAAGSVAAFVVFSFLSIIDIWNIRKK